MLRGFWREEKKGVRGLRGFSGFRGFLEGLGF